MILSTMRFSKWVTSSKTTVATLKETGLEYNVNSFIFMLAPNTMYMIGNGCDYKISGIKYFDVTNHEGNDCKYKVKVYTYGYYVEDDDEEYVIYLK